LKLLCLTVFLVSLVAPRVGAWIETSTSKWMWAQPLSPPAWGRGLKQDAPKMH